MKFLFFSAQYFPTVGGVERYTNSLALKLIEKGHSVTIVTSGVKGLPYHEIDNDNIEIFRLPVARLMSGRFPFILLSKKLFDFFRWFKENKPDVIVIQTRFYINSLLGAYLAEKYNINAIVIDHSTSHLLQGGAIGAIGGIYEHMACKYIYKRCKNFYGVSKNCCNWLEHFSIKSKGVLYNAINLDMIESIIPAKSEDINIADSTIVILFLGRLIEEKGVFKLIDAFKQLNYKKEKAALIIAGDGPIIEAVLEKKQDNIIVMGKLSYDKSIALMKRADIFCLPTDYPEGFPTTILEAAGCRTFTITTDKGGSRELIKTEQQGVILTENTPNSIMVAIEKAIDKPNYRKECADNAYSLVAESFTWDKISNRLIEITGG